MNEARTSVELRSDLSKALSILAVQNEVKKKQLIDRAVKYALENPKEVLGLK